MTTLTIASNVNNDLSSVAPSDIYLNSAGDIATSYNQQAVLEACAQAARTVLGEIILNTEIGIPFFQAVWQGKPNVQQYTSALRNAFLAVAGGGVVKDVISLTTAQNGDELLYSATIKTIYGLETISDAITRM